MALIDTAQTYLNRKDLYSLVAFLKERLDTTYRSPSPTHIALTRLPINVVFTANYDDLLKRAYHDAGKRVQIVFRDTHIPFMLKGADTVNISEALWRSS